ncbi:MAG: bile acid:sodium symporter [Burkholderiales bacterium]|nr:bile acid:sodium symporter [Burkholderiales bacterium]
MDTKHLILLALQVAIFATVFGFGLQAKLDDVAYILRRPGLLLRSLLAMFVVMPILVVLLVKAFEFRIPVEVVLVVLAISPIPPLLPKRERKAGGVPSYGLGLMLVLGVAAIVLTPLLVEVMARVFDRPLTMSPGVIARIVVVMILVPLAAGMIVRALLPRVAAWLHNPVRWVATGLLGLGVLAILAGSWSEIWAATGGGTVIAIFAFIVVGLAVGHLLGGPVPEHATVLALSTACRHPAIALAVASANYPNEHFGGIVLLYLLVSLIAGVPYVKWQRQRALRATAA